MAGSVRRRDEKRTGGTRPLPAIALMLGFAVIVLTQSVQRGLITGIDVDWQAYIVGGVMMVVGLVGLRGEKPAPPSTIGPLRESGLEPEEADAEIRFQEDVRKTTAARGNEFQSGSG
ncbi:MAG: hypothetical protein ABTQ29_02275 [Siculibacillus sp.]